MIGKRVKKLLAYGLSMAMIASSLTMLPGNSAAAAGKKKALVKLSSTKLSLNVGKTKTLKVKKTKVKKMKSTKWSSNKKTVATVSKKGKVTAKKAGSAKITAKVKYIPKGKKKAVTKKLVCKVTVKAESSTPSGNSSGTTVPGGSSSGGNSTSTTAPGGSTSGGNNTSTTVPGVNSTSTPLPGETSPTAVPDETTPAPGETTPAPAKPTVDPDAPPSNLGEPRTITLSDGTELTIKDNGSVRKDVTAQYIADNEMKTGANLGNTLEATWSLDYKRGARFSRKDYDKAWDQPETTRAYIECLHSYGINTLRLPVAWSNGDKDDGYYTIDPLLLDRVEEIANYALDLGMYVIINDHWDNQWWGQFGACKFEYSTDEDGNEVKTKVVNEELRAEAWIRYEIYWEQIASRFKNYSDHLIFEGANEELGDRLNDEIVISDDYKGYAKPSTATKDTVVCSGNLKTEECYEMVNQINQKFVDIIRRSGGNNAYRFLLIPGYNTDMTATCNKQNDAGGYLYQMPADTAENGKNKLFLSLHFYNPTSYALDNGGGDYTEEDREMTKELFSYIKRFSDDGYATIIGECAVCEPSAVVGNVITWYTDVFTESAKYHAVPCIWDTGAYFDREEPCINYKDVADFLNEWNGAEGSTEGVTRLTGGGQPSTGTDIEVPDYIDAELWQNPGLHAYTFYQTNTFNYRDSYIPLRNLRKGAHSWDFVSTATETTEVTDVDLTEDGAQYTVKINNFGLSGSKYNMLGISTNIERKNVYTDLNMKATATSVLIDGVEMLKEEREMPIKTDNQYATFCVVNAYGGDAENFPLGVLNDNESLPMPNTSIEITFRIEGIGPVLADIESGEFVDPETGLTINELKAQ
ncbi:MAG: cellulase family glycosylhydrolase [Lachnospiraceae bacterium]|nr:cellulase family glycosylhydrolase [Lachnospiraceae bacterium]